MTYLKVGPHLVFLTHQRYAALNAAALSDKDALFQVGSYIEGNPASPEAKKLRYRHLHVLYATEPSTFVRDWVQFDLHGEEAGANAWDLLNDYCHYSRIGSLATQQSEIEAIFRGYFENTLAYPMGRIFELRICGPHTIGSIIGFTTRRELAAIEVDTRQIKSASGSLTDFILSFEHQTFECGNEFRICSPKTPGPPQSAPVG